ncbi:LAFE_0F01112g1_1 [Lachancea fermentati]|uniref:LAFE_0F01112g1_1 n=1 Tax=Lachancea fermentati TaxID=4955 RepID=A0A1G4MEB4_LACFM|nr:LAFE_0F01112g1_1 [Lachancea fermentati]
MENNDLLEKALELGTTYFKSGDFSNANKLFTKAIHLACSYRESDIENLRQRCGLPKRSVHDSTKTTHPRLVKLLDNRSASWEKLGQLQKALKDAKKMIREEPYNVKGYIRCGKVLQKLQEDDEAYNIYEKGLKMAKEGNEKFQIRVIPKFVDIIKFQQRLIRSRKEPKLQRRDIKGIKRKRDVSNQNFSSNEKLLKLGNDFHFDILGHCPLEITKNILKEFDSKSLSSLMLVSKSWYFRIGILSDLFRSFDLSGSTYKRILTFQLFVNKLFEHQGGIRLHTLKYSSSTSMAEDKSVSALLDMATLSLKSLSLQTKACDFERLSERFSMNSTLSGSLEELSLVCHYKRTLSASAELNFLSKATSLRRLELFFPDLIQQRSSSRLKAQSSRIEKHILQNLESLKIVCDLKKVSPFFPFKCALLVDEPYANLSKVSICGVTFDSTFGFGWILNFPNLRELWLENNKNVFLKDFIDVMVYSHVFKCMEKLTFREHRIGSNPVNLHEYPNLLENPNLVSNFCHLRILDLMGSSIGGRGLLSIVTCIPNNVIRRLNIGDCPFMHYQRSTDNGYLNLGSLLPKLPHIEELFLHQSVAFDDYAVQLLTQNVKYTKKLRKLDLSFNMSITGASIYELLRELKESEYIVLDKLVIDACPSISKHTMSIIKQNGFVRELSCSYEKMTWKIFGINTLVTA